MLRIAIVDDEQAIREGIKSLIKVQYPEYAADSFASGEELLSSGKTYNIVFLDIQMEGMSGMDAARALRRGNDASVIVFITGIKDHVFDAFDVSAFHYLLKPIDGAKFAEVLRRAVAEAARQQESRNPPVCIKTKTRNFTLDRDSVLYAENRGKKVELHTVQEVIELYASMGELEDQLGPGFYRCHRGYLVNMAHIREYSGDSIRLHNGESIYLARERYNDFIKAYMRYLREGGNCHV